MGSIASPRFYVYILCRPNGKPFYVGKGKTHRVYEHETEARRGHKCHKCNVIRKIWRDGGQVQKYIIFETDDEHEAFAYERETIALYGRDNLTNVTDGGEGPGGANPSPAVRKILGKAQVARFARSEERAKQRARITAYFAQPGAREKQRDATNRFYASRPAREDTCLVCGVTFQGLGVVPLKYCSKACKAKAYRRRKAAKKL